MEQALSSKFHDPRQGVYYVGTIPPKANTDDPSMAAIADKLLGRLSYIDYDGLIVYDIQDESSRTDQPRPFPFISTRDPRTYSAMLREKSGHPVITYKSVSQRSADDFRRWIADAWHHYDVRHLVLVGSPNARSGEVQLPLGEAYGLLRESPHPFSLGGVTIAERHEKKGDEDRRLFHKMDQGCEFFVSQAVYDARATINLLTDYADHCREQGIKPGRVILTFTPCGSAKTLEFMQWLGISIPYNTSEQILQAKNPVSESIRICRANLNAILYACLPLGIPLGLNIESLTNRKEEIEASIRLFKLLKATLEERLAEFYRPMESPLV